MYDYFRNEAMDSIDPQTGLPFDNNQIPAFRIDPYAAGILGLVPGSNQSGVNNFFRNANLTDDADRVLSRVDFRPSIADSVFVRHFYSNRDRQVPGALGGVIDGTGTSAFGNQTIRTNGIVGGWTRVLSNTMINDFRFSWARSRGYGVFYNLFDRVGSEDQLALNLPGLIDTSVTRTSGSPVFFLKDGIPANFLKLPNLDPSAGELKTIRVRAVTVDAPKTMMQQASAGIQREVGFAMVLSADSQF